MKIGLNWFTFIKIYFLLGKLEENNLTKFYDTYFFPVHNMLLITVVELLFYYIPGNLISSVLYIHLERSTTNILYILSLHYLEFTFTATSLNAAQNICGELVKNIYLSKYCKYILVYQYLPNARRHDAMESKHEFENSKVDPLRRVTHTGSICIVQISGQSFLFKSINFDIGTVDDRHITVHCKKTSARKAVNFKDFILQRSRRYWQIN